MRSARPQEFWEWSDGIENQWENRESDYSIAVISQYTQKSPWDLRKLTVTQTPIKDHQVTLVGKTRNDNDNLWNIVI